MEDDWDLHAVVRGCNATSTATTSAVDPVATCDDFSGRSKEVNLCDDFTANNHPQDLFHHRKDSFNIEQDLHDHYKSFLSDLQKPRISTPSVASNSSKSLPISPLSVLGGFQDPSSSEQRQQQRPQQLFQQPLISHKQQPFSVSSSSKASISSVTHNSRSSKRRKNSLKRVCHVSAEGLSSDMWSWRKYGQKPIKGSPYPRGYYKCSTLKGCLARKQVERHRSDPGMFVITYTGEHNHPMPTHRNSLAGCSRLKTTTPSNPTGENAEKPAGSPELSPTASLTRTPEKQESSLEDVVEPDDDDDLSVSDMALDYDFFAGLEDLACPDAGGSIVDDCLPESLQYSWLDKGPTTGGSGG